MNILSGKKTEGEINGQLQFLSEGVPPEKLLPGVIAYIYNYSPLLGMLTIKETLYFAAKNRLHNSISDHEVDSRIVTLISELELHRFTNSYVDSLTLLQKKLVILGIELISGPKFLFGDNPLEGLDECNAYEYMSILRKVIFSFFLFQKKKTFKKPFKVIRAKYSQIN